MRVIVMIPVRPDLNPTLRETAYRNGGLIPQANPDLSVSVLFGAFPEAKLEGDVRAWSRVSRVRNRMIESINLDQFDYVCWIDADVVEYAPDIVGKLIETNPTGVSAPMVLVERETDYFYDWAAFVMRGKDGIEPDNIAAQHGRQLEGAAPHWPQEPADRVVEMDCVGTCYTVPTDVYREASGAPVHLDHPAFTDHYNLCLLARLMGRRVTVNRDLRVYHARLPDYGESWH